MLKIANHISWHRMLICAVVIAGGVFSYACNASQNNDLPEIHPIEKGNPKLDSQLNQLVAAEASGEAEQFASQSGITLTEGKVRVIIECLPGRLDEAAQAVEDAGAAVEASHNDLLQVLAPVGILSGLTEEESVRLIRLPMAAVPDTGTGNNPDERNVSRVQEISL